MLTNSAIGGATAALYVTTLVLHLNPRYALSGVPGLVATLTLLYGLHVTAALYALMVVRQLVASEVISPGWISVRFLVGISSLVAVSGSVLMWVNLRGFGPVLDPSTVPRMTAGAVALSLCAAVFVALALGRQWMGRHSSGVGAAALALALLASLAVPLTLRGPGIGKARSMRWPQITNQTAQAPGDGRIILLLFEGASLDIIAPAAAEGRLPHFARLLDAGASLHLATIRPTQPAAVWTAVATGNLPVKNGIRSAATYGPLGTQDALEVLPDFCFAHALVRFGLLREIMHTSGDLRALPLWTILGTQGVSVGIVNWAITQPARPVRGYLVTDQFERLHASSVDVDNAQGVWPRDAVSIAASAASRVAAEPGPGTALRGDDMTRLLAKSCRADRVFEQVALDMEHQYPSRFHAVRYSCLDAWGHYLLRYAMPGAFGDVSDEEMLKYGAALGTYYATADAVVGRAIATLKPGDLLLVASGFGMEPMGIGKRLLERTIGNPELSGTHERAPDGFLMAFGSAVRPGRYPRGSIVDLTPTILYYLGLPVGHDMDGYARTDMFDPGFAADRPITFIPSYER